MSGNDRKAFLMGAYQSLLLGGLMRFFGALAGLGGVSPFIVGLGFVGFSLGVWEAEKEKGKDKGGGKDNTKTQRHGEEKEKIEHRDTEDTEKGRGKEKAFEPRINTDGHGEKIKEKDEDEEAEQTLGGPRKDKEKEKDNTKTQRHGEEKEKIEHRDTEDTEKGREKRKGKDIRFVVSSGALGFLIISRLYFFSIFRTMFMGESPWAKFFLLAVSVWLACYLFSYIGYRYSGVLRAAERPVRNYAFLAAGFSVGTAGFGAVSAFLGPDAGFSAALLLGAALVERRKLKYAGAVFTLAAILLAIPIGNRYFDSIAFTWGVTDYRRAASEWSPYYKVDLLTYNNGDSMCGLYNYTCMMLAFREDGSAAEKRKRAARYFLALHEASIPAGAEKVLIVGSGMGPGHPATTHASVKKITAVEIDPVIVRLMTGKFSGYNHGFYRDPRVESVVAEGRRYLEKSREKYDFIEYESLDTRMYSTAMNVVPVENSLYTREGIARAMGRLAEGGLFRITIGTDDDGNVVRPLVSALPADAYYGVYRVWMDMAGLAGIGEGVKKLKGSLGGYTGRMPQTVIFASWDREAVERIRAWHEALGAEAEGNIARLDVEPEPGLAPADDRPFIGGPEGLGRRKGMIFAVLLIVMIVPAAAAGRGNANGRMHYFFYLIGAGYVGLEILLLARGARSSLNPALTTLEIAAAFLVGNAAACAAAEARRPGKGALTAAAALLAVMVHFSYALSFSPGLAVCAGAAAGFLGGLFWPAALAGLESRRRGAALFSDTLGVFPGIVIFHGALFSSGFGSAGVCVAAMYVLAAAVFVVEKKKDKSI